MSAVLTPLGIVPHLPALNRAWAQIPEALRVPLCVRELGEQAWHQAYDSTDRRGHVIPDNHTSFATSTDDGRMMVDFRKSRMPGACFLLAHELTHVLWGHVIPQARKDAWERFYGRWKGSHPSDYRRDSPEEQLCEGFVAYCIHPLPPGYRALAPAWRRAEVACLGVA